MLELSKNQQRQSLSKASLLEIRLRLLMMIAGAILFILAILL